MGVALAVEDSSAMDSINMSYKQLAKSILVTVTDKMQTQVPLIQASTVLPRQTVQERSVSTQN